MANVDWAKKEGGNAFGCRTAAVGEGEKNAIGIVTYLGGDGESIKAAANSQKK